MAELPDESEFDDTAEGGGGEDAKVEEEDGEFGDVLD